MTRKGRVLALLSVLHLAMAQSACSIVAGGLRQSEAAEMPDGLGGNGGEAPQTLPRVAIDRETWNAIKIAKGVTCAKGAANTSKDMKEFQDMIGRANLYRDAAATQVSALPLPTDGGQVESVSFECGEDLLLGVNGFGIRPEAIQIFYFLEGIRADFHLFGFDSKSGDVLWVYFAANLGNGSKMAADASAVNVKRFWPKKLDRTGLLSLHGVARAELVMFDQGAGDGGLYLGFSANAPRVGLAAVGEN